jgi:hypothetical protein
VTVISSAHGVSSGEVTGSGRGQSNAQSLHLSVGTEKKKLGTILTFDWRN